MKQFIRNDYRIWLYSKLFRYAISFLVHECDHYDNNYRTRQCKKITRDFMLMFAMMYEVPLVQPIVCLISLLPVEVSQNSFVSRMFKFAKNDITVRLCSLLLLYF